MSTMKNAAIDKEALRQQMLLRALWRDARPGVVAGWLRDAPQRFQRGLAAYQANASALAERSLAAAYPTLQQLVGSDSFAAMARAFWHRHAPQRGDLAQWGEALPAFIADSESLAGEPFLADVAQLEWALHAAEGAADSQAAPVGLDLLARCDPETIRLRFAPGLALIESAHPIVAIWRAHQHSAGAGDERFAAVREAFAAGRGETALVWRDGLRARAQALGAGDAAFTHALLAGRTLGAALAGAGSEFDFEPWLIRALRERWIDAIEPRSGSLA